MESEKDLLSLVRCLKSVNYMCRSLFSLKTNCHGFSKVTSYRLYLCPTKVSLIDKDTYQLSQPMSPRKSKKGASIWGHPVLNIFSSPTRPRAVALRSQPHKLFDFCVEQQSSYTSIFRALKFWSNPE